MTYQPGRFSGCRFCHGDGCAACDGEYTRSLNPPPPEPPLRLEPVSQEELERMYRNYEQNAALDDLYGLRGR